jgi:hypothetical protein
MNLTRLALNVYFIDKPHNKFVSKSTKNQS